MALSVIAGPLGLFYASTKGALLVLTATVVGVGLSGPEMVPMVWPLGSLASVIWSLVAISAHNRAADATDTANLAAWQAQQVAIPPE